MPLSRQNSATDVVMGDWSIWVRCHPGVTKHVLPFISAEVGCPKTSGILPLVKETHNDSSGLRSKTLGVLEHCGRNISKGKDKRLFERRHGLFTDLSVVFMDLTNLSFAGDGGERLAEYVY